jgi:hypothetical protein
MLRRVLTSGLAAVLLATASACAPTIHVKVEPITIYAKLDANIRIRLDDDVKKAIQAHPELF